MKLLWGTTVFGKGSDGPGGIQIHYGGKFYSRAPHRYILLYNYDHRFGHGSQTPEN